MKSSDLLKQINDEFENLNTYLLLKGMEIVHSNDKLKKKVAELEAELEKIKQENYYLKRNINFN
jgi:cell division protein FtsB